ncbi:MAG: PIN domain-containing protein [Methanoregula sp.]
MTGTGLLVDTFTWIEIFKDTAWGNHAMKYIEKHSPVFISVLTLYELQCRLLEMYGDEKTSSLLETILVHTDAIPVDNLIAVRAGSINAEQKRANSKMGAVDCMILATAQIHHLGLLAGDKHFYGLEESVII